MRRAALRRRPALDSNRQCHAPLAAPSHPLALPPPGPIMKISVEELCKRRRLGLIAGGSGLTPMLQACRAHAQSAP